ncbi:MAG: zf-HC2 domain-containing protein [Acidobacteria bacterium]|nr:zf-HC2 domain-containing protein [Acidobacteriota bacterium]
MRQPALYPALHNAVLAEAEPMHLAFEQLADFVDGRLSGEPQQFARDHLSQCQQCGAAVDDLRAFSHAIADDLATRRKPAMNPPPSLGEKLRVFFASSWAMPVSVTIALLVFGLIGWQMFKRDDSRIAVVTPSPTPTPMMLPTATIEPTATPNNLLAQLNDGATQFALDAQGRLQGADEWPERYRQLAQQALQADRMSRPAALSGLGSASAALMGQGQESGFALIEPAGKVVLTDRPVLRWQPLAGAQSYQVELVNEQYETVAQSEALTSTSWQVPQALARGRVYSWQVKASKDGETVKAPQPPAPLARFRVTGQKEFAEIQDARHRFGSSHLLLGQLYAEAGLLDEAEREFRALQKANPASPIPKQLLAELRKLRR